MGAALSALGTGRVGPLARTALTVVVLLLLLPTHALAAAVAADTSATLVESLPLPTSLVGPESVAFNEYGEGPYTGVSDGRVLRYDGADRGWTTYSTAPGYNVARCMAPKLRPGEFTESVCGRPLGLQFHNTSGNLYIADAYKGLMRVGPRGGEATVLATEADGVPFRFTNGVDVDQVTSEVYFTDSSTRFPRSQNERVTTTGDSTGRLMKYDPTTGHTAVLDSGMPYPNGVSLSADRSHLVVALTGPCKLVRHWIKGAKAGTSEPFAELPGYPDNVRADGKGGYWVALNREKSESPYGSEDHVIAVRVSRSGKVVEKLRGPKNVRPSEVIERDGGKLYLGSVELNRVSIVKATS
ncbi:protein STRICTOSIDINE SYNTHASE-LIKE 10-like [Oryza brachyantha]|uniref:protein STRICTOSIDINE SYNTHASE-LIKE 10-like n=1 Tax=Oryza brachyantha TaxID=4533 RepID=UPI001ADA6F16|nr:protein STRICTOSIDINE SYNTHASE-LIKE 10-like [Oryza brachyantha]